MQAPRPGDTVQSARRGHKAKATGYPTNTRKQATISLSYLHFMHIYKIYIYGCSQNDSPPLTYSAEVLIQ